MAATSKARRSAPSRRAPLMLTSESRCAVGVPRQGLAHTCSNCPRRRRESAVAPGHRLDAKVRDVDGGPCIRIERRSDSPQVVERHIDFDLYVARPPHLVTERAAYCGAC